MSDKPGAEVPKAQQKVSLWDFPPTWFGFGAGMMAGAYGGGGSPWYRPALVAFAGLCVAVAMLRHMRKGQSPS
jgi:uncharacterized membrane protein YfcA